jgi:hypothetical protein
VYIVRLQAVWMASHEALHDQSSKIGLVHPTFLENVYTSISKPFHSCSSLFSPRVRGSLLLRVRVPT